MSLRIPRSGFGFCIAIGVIAAAIADPIVESASNAGWFGPGSFTDRSNVDVIPALIAGVALLALFMLRKARAVLAGDVLRRGLPTLVPWIFVFQVLTLYLMETLEQLFVFGHALGATIWLGAPLPISLLIHASVCVTMTYAILRSRRTLAATALRVIRLVVAIATRAAQCAVPIARQRTTRCFKDLLPLLCAIGERAPPLGAG